MEDEGTARREEDADEIWSGRCGIGGTSWSAEGKFIYRHAISQRVLFFAILAAESGATVDCIARCQDGWSAHDLVALAFAVNTDEAVAVLGFSEQLPAEQGGLTVLHAQCITIGGARTWRAVPPVLQDAPLRTLSVNRRSNESRFPAFTEFLVEEFGHSELCAGCGVLDVAGGSGGLAYELSVRRQIPCVVVDPREVRLTSTQRYTIENRHITREALAPYLGRSPLARSTYDKYHIRPVRQLRLMLDSRALIQVSAQDAQARDGEQCAPCTDELDRAAPPADSYAGLSELSAAARDCSVIVGMHPDQALDHVIDLALALGKPFAVVPCCVFWKHGRNPNRRTPSGAVVKTYEQLCEYVATRAPGVREATLHFHGLNRVFVWRPPSKPHAAAEEGRVQRV